MCFIPVFDVVHVITAFRFLARCSHGPTEGIVTRNGSGRLTIVDTAGRSRNIIPRTRDTQASVTYLAHTLVSTYLVARSARAHNTHTPTTYTYLQ